MPSALVQQFARHDICSMVCICPEGARFPSAFVSAYLPAVGKDWSEALLWMVVAYIFFWLGLSRVLCDLPTIKLEFFHQQSEMKAELSVPALLLCPVLALPVSALPIPLGHFPGIILQFSTQLPHTGPFCTQKVRLEFISLFSEWSIQKLGVLLFFSLFLPM